MQQKDAAPDAPTSKSNEPCEDAASDDRAGCEVSPDPGSFEGPDAVTQEAGKDSREEPQKSGLKPAQLVGSVLAAALGVQSAKNRERDFQQGRAGTFIAAGIIATAIFIGAVYTVVSIVLSTR